MTADDEQENDGREDILSLANRARAAAAAPSTTDGGLADKEIENISDLIDSAVTQARHMYDLMQRLAELLEQDK